MTKAKKKPLLIGFIELEREYIKLKAQAQGVTQGSYVRGIIAKQLIKEGFDMDSQA